MQINPLMRRKVPTSNREIMSRVQEISFNSSLLVELRAIEFVNRMIDEGRLPRGTAEGEFRKIRVHRIVLEGFGERMSSSSKTRNDYDVVLAAQEARPARGAASFSTRIMTTSALPARVEVKSEIFAGAR